MLSKTDLGKLYDAILSTPGMDEKVKVTIQASRKDLLLLNKAIERGLNIDGKLNEGQDILACVSKDALQDISTLSEQMLDKAGLVKIKEKLESF